MEGVLGALSAALQCPGCKATFKDPVTAPCGHTLCAACIVGKSRCGVCDATFAAPVAHVPSSAVAAMLTALGLPAASAPAPAPAPATAPVPAPAPAPALAAAAGGSSSTGPASGSGGSGEASTADMSAEEVERRMHDMRGAGRRAGVALRAAAVEAFKSRYADHMLPVSVVAATLTHLARKPTWSDDECAAYIATTLDSGDHPRFVTATQAECLATIRGRGGQLHGMPSCSALVSRTIDPWNLTWDGMDYCTLTCLEMRAGVYPVDEGDIWAWLHSRAAATLRGGGTCCQCAKAWPGARAR